jgi:hypothetical protein
MKLLTFGIFGVALAALVAGAVSVAWPAETRSATLLYPDLQTLPAKDLRFDVVALEDGSTTHVLRFSNTIWNSGRGPLEIIANSTGGTTQRNVSQRIYDDAGGSTDFPSGYIYYHDTHSHWHFDNFATYRLFQVVNGALEELTEKRGQKSSFCIIDTTRVSTKLPGAPKSAVYRLCSGFTQPQGLSVGWGDTFTASLPDQWIVLGDSFLGDGTYAIRSTADPANRIAELDDTNNGYDTYFIVSNGRIRVLK